MEAIFGVLFSLFYVANLAALAFFVHKVFWLVQYRRLQRTIVEEAVRRLRQGNEADLAEWEEFAKRCWSNALGFADIHSPSTFIRRVEEGFAQVRGDLRSQRPSVAALMSQALSAGKGATGGERTKLVTIRRLTRKSETIDEQYQVGIDLRFRAVPAPRPPDRKLYELHVKSRYGFVQRALVFLSGIADIVYSSQHVALMSQNVHVPLGTLMRRLLLVFLVLCVVLVDLFFKVRKELTGMIEGYLSGSPTPSGSIEPGFVSTALGFGAWIALYGSVYLMVYFSVRRRYQVSVRKLRSMEQDEPGALSRIHEGHLADLSRWGAEYGRMLDNAIEITLRHAETLLDHYGHRLRRRVSGSALLDASKTIADCLFRKLPESRGDLQDIATTQRHSLRHYVWPRGEEMGYQVVLAQYRAAWQELELMVSELRREQPDPALAHALWRSATLYAVVFAPLLPTGMAEELRQAYAQMVTDSVAQTDYDLAELDRRLGELTRGLGDQLEAARGLVASRVELSSSQMQAAVAALSTEIIRVREQARLEAMAFEI